MAEQVLPRVCELAECREGDEFRAVSLIWANELAIIERSHGPVTEAAYGSWAHGHKVLCPYEACVSVFGVSAEDLEEALVRFFAGSGEVAQLSDFMDLLDARGERYAYLAWSGDGDGALRPREME